MSGLSQERSGDLVQGPFLLPTARIRVLCGMFRPRQRQRLHEVQQFHHETDWLRVAIGSGGVCRTNQTTRRSGPCGDHGEIQAAEHPQIVKCLRFRKEHGPVAIFRADSRVTPSFHSNRYN
jgi:hypothetical protein